MSAPSPSMPNSPSPPPSASQLSSPAAVLQQAAHGSLPIVELFNATQNLINAGQAAQAIALYRVWIVNTPSPLAYAVYFNLAVALSGIQDDAGAELSYRRALALKPDFIEAQLNLGTLQERRGQPDAALATWEAALPVMDAAAEPGFYTQALNNLGRLLEIQKRYPEAEARLQRSLEIEPKQPSVITHWVHLRQKQCKWPVYAPLKGLSKQDMINATSALATLSASGDPAVQLAAARRFVSEKVLSGVAPLSRPASYGHQRLRIGYMSSDFCSHAVAILTAELFELHDRTKVEVYGFCWSREDGSPLRARVVAGMDQHIRIDAMSDEQAAHCIRGHEIDVLIDLHGLTLGTRPDILSYRPAPVQLTYLGFPGPTALPEIDYVLADDFVLPPELAAHFTEKPLYLPHSFQINDRQRSVGPQPSRASCGLPEDAFVFCSFNNNHKFTPAIFAIWMRILQRTPGSVLWLIADSAEVRENLSLAAETAGVNRARLVFAGRVVPDAYLARFKAADLFLDTLPFNAGTTASDALWAGLPLLTCAGHTFAGRMAGSLLRAANLPELITYTLADYENLAVELAHHPQRIAAMKQKLADERLTCPLFDSPRFVRDLEQVLLQVAFTSPVAQPAMANANASDTATAAPAQAAPPVAQAAAPAAVAPIPTLHEPAAAPATGATPAPAPLPAAPPQALPLVSVLIPTHNRPDYLEIALNSVLAQTYGNIQIVISDNGDDELSRERLAPYLARHPHIIYYRQRGMTAVENFRKCMELSTGEYINYLMDDDVFHPEKIQRMMYYYLHHPDTGLVTSYRQLIDADGRHLPQLPGTEQLFQVDTAVTGESMGKLMLANGNNLVGEPTTVLVRRRDIEPVFGRFAGHNYTVLVDVAAWLSILAKGNCIYLSDTLSYFRIHGAQDQRGNSIRIRSSVEWFGMFFAARQNDLFFHDEAEWLGLLSGKLAGFAAYVAQNHAEIRDGHYQLDDIYGVLDKGYRILLGKH